MTNLDRSSIVDLLGRLGADSDEAILAAARELHAKVGESGLSWDDLIRPQSDLTGAAAQTEAAADAPPIEAAAQDEPAQTDGEVPAADKAEAARLIERLLARKNLSGTLRKDLDGMKAAIADGSFDAMDSRYIRALARRLGA